MSAAVPVIREFRPEDAPAISALVRLTMRVSSSADYPPERLEPLVEYFSPEKIIQLNLDRFCVVAELDAQIVGTAALEGEHVCTFFVHPHYQRRGIGARLLSEIESAATRLGLKQVFIEASVAGTLFYEHHGYLRTGRTREGVAGQQVEVKKNLVTPRPV